MSIFSALKSKLFQTSSKNNVRETEPLLLGKSISELQSSAVSSWDQFGDVYGMRFLATIQLRTPLRVLRRHGEIFKDRNLPAPEVTKSSWEGIWLPCVSSRPMGGSMASDIGPIPADGGDYIPYLMFVRAILESEEPIEVRVGKLRSMVLKKEWEPFVTKLGGRESIVKRFFPEFLSTIPSLGQDAVKELQLLGADTPNRLGALSDAELLAIKGIGPAKMKKVREYCGKITSNRDCSRLDEVIL